MRLDYTENKVFTVDMTDYIDDIVTEFFEEYPDEFKKMRKIHFCQPKRSISGQDKSPKYYTQ
jgi:hypothetical protein